jgi:rubrerythrin
LLKFGICGVQEFISQARKVRDFSAGSKLISKMSEAALQHAASHGGGVLLPSVTDGPIEHCPQQIVVMIRGKVATDVRSLGQSMIEAAQECFKTSVDQAAEGIALSQLDSAFECYWVATPLTEDERESYIKVAAAFDSRKHTRTFSALENLREEVEPWSCSLCGVRVALYQGAASKRERLCAVCAAKRAFGMEKLDHPGSTYSLARARFYRDPAFAQLVKEYGVNAWEDVFDAWEELGDPKIPLYNKKKALLPAFQALTGDNKLYRHYEKLSPYYAVVLFDGDYMSKWFSGEFFPQEDGGEGFFAKQGMLSGALLGFARSLKRLADNHRAKLVYAGGDDGFMFCPLDALLPMIAAIRESWASAQDEVKRELNIDSPPTLSLHASVVHAKQPLQPVVADLHRKLEEAKEREDRDCLSVFVWPHSGAPAWAHAKWCEFDDLVEAIEHLSNWRRGDFAAAPSKAELETRKKQRLPSRLPYSLLEAAPGFFDDDRIRLSEALRVEMKRIYSRGGASGETQEAWERLLDWTIERAKVPSDKGRMHGWEPSGKGRMHGWERMESMVKVVTFLARQLEWKRYDLD